MAVSLPHAEDLGDGILCVDTEQQRPRMACCYLVRGGDDYAFVECGTALSVPGLLAVLSARGIAREQVRYVIPTHVHLDHAGGAGVLMRELPQAQLWVHPRGLRHLVDPAQLIAGATAVYGEAHMARAYGEIVPVPAARAHSAEDGTHIQLGDRTLRFMDAPGHARHHLAVWDEQTHGLFTGDVFGLSYREFDSAQGAYLFPTTTPVQFEPEAWLQTLARMMALQPRWAYLTHYGRIGDLARHAAQLAQGVSAYAELARAHAAAPDRVGSLREVLMARCLAEVAAHGSHLNAEQARKLLDMDITLNAQGLDVWLARAA